MAKTYYGGQAVIEGVMMKGKKIYATAVRTPEGDIAVEKKENETILGKYKLFTYRFYDNRYKNSYAQRNIGRRRENGRTSFKI